MCALPSAQLGSMSGINMPSSVPLAVVPNQPKLWQQALVQILTQAGSDAVKTGVANEMSQDNAKDWGKKESTGWNRLVHGPTVSDADARQLLSEKGMTDRQTASEAGANTRLGISERGAESRFTRGQEGETTRQKQTLTSEEKRQAAALKNAQDLAEVNNAAETFRQLRGFDFSGQENAANRGAAATLEGRRENAATTRLEKQLQEERVLREAQAGHLNLQSQQLQQQIELMKRLSSNGNATPTIQPGTPTQVSPQVQAAAADTSRYGEYGRVHPGAQQAGGTTQAAAGAAQLTQPMVDNPTMDEMNRMIKSRPASSVNLNPYGAQLDKFSAEYDAKQAAAHPQRISPQEALNGLLRSGQISPDEYNIRLSALLGNQ